MITSTGCDPGRVEALLAEVARIGPFFAVATGPAPVGGGWVPVRDLGAPAGPWADRVAAVAAALDTDARVAASIAFQGVAAQLVAPLYAAVVLRGALPAAAPDGSGTATWGHEAVPDPSGTTARDQEASSGGIAGALRWRPGGAGPWLWWAGAGRVVACSDAALGAVLGGLLTPLVAAVAPAVGERVAWGNAASAVASARRLVAAARPEAAAGAARVARRLLTAAPWAATAELLPAEPPDLSWTFRRRTCCLYHRVPGGGLCGDCALAEPARP